MGIKGLWALRGKKVIAFSATSSTSYERFMGNVVKQPVVVKFKSEYELVHHTSPIADPAVVACNTEAEVRQALKVDLDKHFD